MAIAVTEPVIENLSTTNATSYTGNSFTPTANSLLVIFVLATDTAATGSMSGGSLTWITRASTVYNSVDKVWMFTAQVGVSPASMSLTFDCTGDSATGCGILSFQVTGHNTDDPVKQVVSNTAASSLGMTFTVSAMDTGNAYMYGISSNSTLSSMVTPPVSWTEIADSGYNNPKTNAEGAYRVTGETGTSVAVVGDLANYGGIFVEINEASHGALPMSPTGQMGFFGL